MSDIQYIDNVENFLEEHFGKSVGVPAKKYILDHFLCRVAECLGVISSPIEHFDLGQMDRAQSFTKLRGYPILKELEEFTGWLRKAPQTVKQAVESTLSGPYGATLVQALFDGLDSFFYHQKGNKGLRQAAKMVYKRVPPITMSELRSALCLEAIRPEVIDDMLYSQLLPVLRCNHEGRIAHFFTKIIRDAVNIKLSQPHEKKTDLIFYDSSDPQLAERKSKRERSEEPSDIVSENGRLETAESLKKLQLEQHHIMHIPENIHYDLFVRPDALDKDVLKKYRLPITNRSTKWEMNKWYEHHEVRQMSHEICKTDMNISHKRAVERLFYHFKRTNEANRSD